MSREVNSIFGKQILVAPGATNAVIVGGTAGQMGGILKYFTGGTLEIASVVPAIGATTSTADTSALISQIGLGYILGTSEAIPFDGAARFYLMASGSTVTAMVARGLSEGY